MTPLFLRLAAGAVLWWTRAYTWGLPTAIRERRLAEIQSDLWESQRDEDGSRTLARAIEVVARLLAGIGDDIGWRLEHGHVLDGLFRIRVALTVGIAAGVVLWIIVAATGSQVPPLPDAPPFSPWWHRGEPPPPPPPPPPPCAPPGLVGGPKTNCAR